MDLHYNAFISYRHHPDDIRVAAQIHKALERFRIPRGLKKKLNITGPMHLFRDKEELPITSNLNDDIGEALRNADYLIVICSPHTKESIWVQREIELFLTTHHRNRVLTVLAGGEPYDVIPEVLLYEDVRDPVTGAVTRNLVEPLSCDWRVPLRKAKHEELPRLVAPLLGCSYDELRQRQKQYRMRRMATVVSLACAASLGFSGYVLRNSMIIRQKNVEIQDQNVQIQDQNVQIQSNLDDALRNQSRHLATAAQELLSEGDRLTAIALAAAALPGENNQRPYVPEAEYVLADALGVYQIAPRVEAVGTIRTGEQVGVKKFWVSQADDALYLYDSRNELSVWDTKTLQKISELEIVGALKNICPLPKGNALVHAGEFGDVIYCFRPDGTCLWQIEDTWSLSVMGEDTVLTVTSPDLDGNELRFLDVTTGQPVRDALDLQVLPSSFSTVKICQEVCDPGDLLMVRYSDLSEYRYMIFDLETGTHWELPLEMEYPEMVKVLPGGLLLLAGESTGNDMVGVFEGNRVSAPRVSQLYCYDMHTKKLLWENSITAYTYGCATLEKIPGKDWLLCQSGAQFLVLDLQDGSVISQCGVASSAVCVSVEEQYARCVLADGYRCNYWYEENYSYETPCLQEDLDQATIVGDTYYGVQFNGTMVTVYREQVAQAQWTGTVENLSYVSDFRAYGKNTVLCDDKQFTMLDTTRQKVLWQIPCDGMRLLEFSGDGKVLWCCRDNQVLVAVDAATGKQTVINLAEEVAGTWGAALRGDLYMGEDILVYQTVGDETGGATVVCRNLNTGKEHSIPLTEPEDGRTLRCQLVLQEENHLWVWTTAGQVLEVDLTTGESRVVLENVTQRPAAAAADDGRIALATLDQICLLTPGGQITRKICLEEAKAGSLCFYEDELLVLCNNAVVYRYDRDLQLLSQTQLRATYAFANNLVSAFNTRDAVLWQFTEDGQLVLNTFGFANVVECDSWKTVAMLQSFLCYVESDNTYLCKVAGGVAAYHRYDYQELLELATAQTGNFSLTAQQKAAYGLS